MGAALLLVAALVAVTTGRAGAAGSGDAVVGAPASGPTVVVGPDHVVDGQVIGVEISGFPPGLALGVQCLASVTTAVQDARSLCRDLGWALPSPGPGTWQARWPSSVTFGSFDGARELACTDDPAGCVVGALAFDVPDDLYSPVVAAAFDDITFGNALTAAPARELTDGAAVTVTGAEVAPGTWSVAQCGRAFLDDPTPTPTRARAAALCGPATPVVVEPDGTFATELTVHDPLAPDGGGGPLACGADGCVVVLSTPGDPATTSRGISFGPATVTLDPVGPYVHGTGITVSVAGAPFGPLRGQTCLPPVGPTSAESRCDGFDLPILATDRGHGSVGTVVLATVVVGPVVHSCREEPCVLAFFDESGRTVAASAPFGVQAPPTATLEPSTGLLDGQPVTLTARGLFPSFPHSVFWCGNGECGGVQHLVSEPDGTLTTTLTASQIPDIPNMQGYCRTDCLVSLIPEGFGETVELRWSMAEGSLAASPDSGLGDGDPVRITGTDLMPTYDGPSRWGFPTGGWSLTQCDAAVLDDPGLLGVLTHCAVAPTTRPVTIEGSTLATELEVQASITRILGGTTDCTATPGACVVGLVRLDLDLRLTTHLIPVDIT